LHAAGSHALSPTHGPIAQPTMLQLIAGGFSQPGSEQKLPKQHDGSSQPS
jgi:hypothetical protein